MVSCSSMKDHKRNWNREVYYLTGLEKVHDSPAGATQGDQGTLQTDRKTGPGAHAVMRVGEVLWGSKAKAKLVNSNQLVSSTVVFSKGCTRGRPWEVGETWSQRESYQELTFAWDSGAVNRGHTLAWGASVHLKLLQDTWQNKMAAESVIPWSSSSQHSTASSSSCIHFPINKPLTFVDCRPLSV